MKKQFGGTMLGIAIGAVAGLMVALLVAVYVTKVPIPFMSAKTAGSGPERDATEAKKNKDWDPNGALAGKGRMPAPPAAETPGLAAPRGPVALPPPAEAPPPGTGTVVVKADPRARASGNNSNSIDPLGDLARSRAGSGSDGSSLNNSSTGDQFAYFVQAGAFKGAGEADAQRAKLAIMGWEAQVTEREQAGRTVYRVRIGPFTRKDDADRTKEKLDDAGLQAALVRVNR